ncbi:MAG: transposase family protein [Bacteroidota bacterium]|nr:transposase family protein [Bacteroidota bacterium]MYI16627.1 hypothetical protein [Rhodothermaceae bacterium]
MEQISKITTDAKVETLLFDMRCSDGSGLKHPKCDRVYPAYDHHVRKWRHLDTGTYHMCLVTQLLRIKCSNHGVRTITVPWASRSARMTSEFGGMVTD